MTNLYLDVHSEEVREKIEEIRLEFSLALQYYELNMDSRAETCLNSCLTKIETLYRKPFINKYLIQQDLLNYVHSLSRTKNFSIVLN